MKKTTFFVAADPAPERIVRKASVPICEGQDESDVFKKTIACAGMKRPASDLLEDSHLIENGLSYNPRREKCPRWYLRY
jgi:hypothetical protein